MVTEKEPNKEKSELEQFFFSGQWSSRDNESISGQGSTLFYTAILRKALPIVLKGLKVRRLLDAPCGDHNWMRHVDLDGIQYLGMDIVEDIVKHNQDKYRSATVSFAQGDITRDRLPDADVMLCRDCLMHLPYNYIWEFLSNFVRSNIPYLLTTTHANPKNRDIAAPGGFHLINLRAEPFSFPDPPVLLHDWIRGARWPERHVGLWTREDILKVLSKAQQPQDGAAYTMPGPERATAPPEPAAKFAAIIAPERLTRVVDIGANPIDGAPPYKPMLDAGLCEVIGFEPNPNAFKALQRRKGPRETYLPFAIGDGREHVLNIYKASGFSSLLEIRPDLASIIPSFSRGVTLREQLPVATRRLDDCDDVPEFDLLKIDMQGSELMIFQNGRRRLSQAVAVQTEVSFLTLYRDQPGFGAIDVEMRSLGFIPHTFAATKKWLVAPLTLHGRRWQPINQLLEGDIVYFRDFTRPDAMTDQQLRQLAMVAHVVYGSYDVAAHCLQALAARKAGSPRLLHDYVDALPPEFQLAPEGRK